MILFEILYLFTLHQHTKTNNSTIFFVIAIFTGEFTILILRKYDFKVCMISFGFYSSHFKFFIHLPCINTQPKTTASFKLWLPLSQVSLLYWYYKNRVLRLVWYRLVFIQLILKFIFIYPALTHSNEQQHHFICVCHCDGWVYFFDTTKIWFYGSCDIVWFLFN